MKRFLLLSLFFILTTSAANAQILKAKAIDEISTVYPKDYVKIEVSKNIVLKGLELKKGYVVTGAISDVQSPRKGAKEACFTFTLTKYKDLSGIEHEITEEIKTTYKQQDFWFNSKFLQETEFSFSPIPNANMNAYGNETDITGRSSQNLNIKPLSIAESLLPKDVSDEIKGDIDYKSGISSEGEDILILSGEKIKLNFPEN